VSIVGLVSVIGFIAAMNYGDSFVVRADKQAVELSREASWSNAILSSPEQTCASMVYVRWMESRGNGEPRSIMSKLISRDRWWSAKVYCEKKGESSGVITREEAMRRTHLAAKRLQRVLEGP